MKIEELRILLPISWEEFKAGHYYTRHKYRKSSDSPSSTRVVQCVRYKTSAGSAGLYTHHSHSFPSMLPAWTQSILGGSVLRLEGKTWDEYPEVTSTYEIPALSKVTSIGVLTRHVAQDAGTLPNVFGLSRAELQQRTVTKVDVAARDPLRTRNSSMAEPRPDENPRLFKSKRTGRGPLQPGWQGALVSGNLTTKQHPSGTAAHSSVGGAASAAGGGPAAKDAAGDKDSGKDVPCPYMCVYILIRADVGLFGVRARAEALILQKVGEALTDYHRVSYCWIDEWLGMKARDALALQTDPDEVVDITLVPTRPAVAGTDAATSSWTPALAAGQAVAAAAAGPLTAAGTMTGGKPRPPLQLRSRL